MDLASLLIRSSKTSPAFLKTNATSHVWPFSAIAELIDNTYDPDVQAQQIKIDYKEVNGINCLTFTDDGSGMDERKLYNMLSFGYSNKPYNDYKPIGRYGNGFKSGSMRLGEDAVVFTRHADTYSVGLLSQTYLKGIQADTVRVPILSFDNSTLSLLNEQAAETDGSVKAILRWTPFKSLESLLDVFNSFERGTKIIIYNLTRRTAKSNQLELNFDPVKHDILYDSALGASSGSAQYRRSLRCYCGILYLKPRMKIYIMGKKVHQRMIAHDLCKTSVLNYNPRWSDHPIKITMGLNPTRDKRTNGASPQNEDYGAMFYNRNRLILAYEKIGCLKQSDGPGVAVVAVLEVDDLTPIHNKQAFAQDSKFNNLIMSLTAKINDYCNELVSNPNVGKSTAEDAWTPDFTWAMCDDCLKWRRLPLGVRTDDLTDVWHCEDNPDENHNKCDIPQEAMEANECDVTSYSTSQSSKRHSRKRRLNPRASDGSSTKKRNSVSAGLSARASSNNSPTTFEHSRNVDESRIASFGRTLRQMTSETQELISQIASPSFTRVRRRSSNAFLEQNDEIRSRSVSQNGLPATKSESNPVIVDLTIDDDTVDDTNAENRSDNNSDSASHDKSSHHDDALDMMRTQILKLKSKFDALRQQAAHSLTKPERCSVSTQTDLTPEDFHSVAMGDKPEYVETEPENGIDVRHSDSEIVARVLIDRPISDGPKNESTNQKGLNLDGTPYSIDRPISYGPRIESTNQNFEFPNTMSYAIDRPIGDEPEPEATNGESEEEKIALLKQYAVRLVEICGVSDLSRRIDVTNTDQLTAVLSQLVENNEDPDD